MKIGIIGAMEVEVETLKSKMTIKNTVKKASMEFFEGSIGNTDVVVVRSGIAKVNAGICAHTLINDFKCTKIINTGVAGSLDNRIDIGDVVISVDAVQHDFSVEAIGFAKGKFLIQDCSRFLQMRPCDKASCMKMCSSPQ